MRVQLGEVREVRVQSFLVSNFFILDFNVLRKVDIDIERLAMGVDVVDKLVDCVEQ